VLAPCAFSLKAILLPAIAELMHVNANIKHGFAGWNVLYGIVRTLKVGNVGIVRVKPSAKSNAVQEYPFTPGLILQ
jgi:hypothetical protein